MRTAGEKRKARGRPRKEGAREENGRLQRDTKREAADKVPLAVRARMSGITIAQAKDQKAGTFIGLLRIRAEQDTRDTIGITKDQYDALVRFGAIARDYRRAIGVPGAGQCEEGGSGNGGPEISEGYVRWCSRARQRHAEAMDAVMEAQMGNRTDHLLGALQYCVVEDLRMWHLVGALRLAANALSAHFEGRKAA